MKASTIILSLLITGMLWISCEKPEIYHSRDFDKSHQKWLDFKSATGDSYRYQTVTSSWVGYSMETTITVEKGEVTKRHFKWIISPHSGMNTDMIPKEALEWAETGANIGSHSSDSGAAAPLTLDEIYAIAPQWLAKRKEVITTFETKNNGMISTCGYRHERCADDCFVGIHIRFIEPLSDDKIN